MLTKWYGVATSDFFLQQARIEGKEGRLWVDESGELTVVNNIRARQKLLEITDIR